MTKPDPIFDFALTTIRQVTSDTHTAADEIERHLKQLRLERSLATTSANNTTQSV